MEPTKTILVVDDEEMIEEMIEAVLERHGCGTTSFTHPHDALQFLVNNADQVILMITDCKMPSMSGPELIKEALKLNPKLRCIVVSGRPDDYSINDVRHAVLKVLPKPFLKSQMVEAVDSVLSRLGVRKERLSKGNGIESV